MAVERMATSPNGAAIQTRLFAGPRSITYRRLVVIAHPLGRLGGSWDDAVVGAVTAALSSCDVVQFNSRGVGKSTGSATFTCVHACVAPSDAPAARARSRIIKRSSITTSSSQPATSTRMKSSSASCVDRLVAHDLTWQGYSAGSMAASLARGPKQMIQQRHVLISYPVSVLWALTVGHTAAFNAGLDALVADNSSDVLEIHGSGDTFTSASKYASWASALQAKATTSGSRFQSIEVPGAGHFWTDGALVWPTLADLAGTARLLANHISTWLALSN